MNIKHKSYQDFDTMQILAVVLQGSVICIRMRCKMMFTSVENIVTYVLTLISMLYLFMQGTFTLVTDIFYSPQVLLYIALTVIIAWLSNSLYYVYVTLVPN